MYIHIYNEFIQHQLLNLPAPGSKSSYRICYPISYHHCAAIDSNRPAASQRRLRKNLIRESHLGHG